MATTTVLATIPEQEKPGSQASYGHAVFSGDESNPVFAIVFSTRGGGVAYSAQKGGKSYVVHNGKAGSHYDGVGGIVLSPDGQRTAYSALIGVKWRMVADGREGPMYDAVGEPVFSPDGRHVAYEALTGDKWHVVLDGAVSRDAKSMYGNPVFSNDATKVAYIENLGVNGRNRLIVTDSAFKKQSIRESVGELMAVTQDLTKIAAVMLADNRQSVIEFSFADPDRVEKERSYDFVSNLAFGPEGVSVSYVAKQGDARLLILNGREERLPEGELLEPPVVRPDGKGAGVLMIFQGGAFFHQGFVKEEVGDKKYDEAACLTYSKDGSLHAYAARKGKSWFVVVNGKEGPVFDRVVTPVFSPDGRFLIYRARKNGKRFVVVADTSGKTIRQHSAYEQVFQPVFTSDGKSVAYGVKDGNKLIWEVEKME